MLPLGSNCNEYGWLWPGNEILAAPVSGGYRVTRLTEDLYSIGL
jgi:hypothetical protein